MSVNHGLDDELNPYNNNLLDPLDQVPESQMKKFLFHHCAVEDDVYSFPSDDEVVVQDTFVSDDRRKYFNSSTIPEQARSQLEMLMEKHKDLFACNADHRRLSWMVISQQCWILN
jgi:hypothetical protein